MRGMSVASMAMARVTINLSAETRVCPSLLVEVIAGSIQTDGLVDLPDSSLPKAGEAVWAAG